MAKNLALYAFAVGRGAVSVEHVFWSDQRVHLRVRDSELNLSVLRNQPQIHLSGNLMSYTITDANCNQYVLTGEGSYRIFDVSVL